MKTVLICASMLALVGCGPNPDMPLRAETKADAAVRDNERIEVQRIGIFQDDLAYNGRRGVYIVRDKQNGREYIGVSGVGISELAARYAGKTLVSSER